MAQLTFPESMEKLDVDDAKQSLRVLENYIGYICERTDFSMRNMTKLVNAAGVSSVELYILIQAQAQVLASLQSTLNQLSGTVTSLSSTVNSLNTTMGDADTPGTVLYRLDDLNTRVTALEQQNT